MEPLLCRYYYIDKDNQQHFITQCAVSTTTYAHQAVIEDWQAEQKRLALGFQSDVTALKYDIGEQAQRVLSAWSKNFSNPARAEQLFVEMYAEKPKTALWYANHRANVFGECESISEITLTDKNFVLAKAEIIGIRNILYAQTKQFEITR